MQSPAKHNLPATDVVGDIRRAHGAITMRYLLIVLSLVSLNLITLAIPSSAFAEDTAAEQRVGLLFNWGNTYAKVSGQYIVSSGTLAMSVILPTMRNKKAFVEAMLLLPHQPAARVSIGYGFVPNETARFGWLASGMAQGNLQRSETHSAWGVTFAPMVAISARFFFSLGIGYRATLDEKIGPLQHGISLEPAFTFRIF